MSKNFLFSAKGQMGDQMGDRKMTDLVEAGDIASVENMLVAGMDANTARDGVSLHLIYA